MNSRRTLIIFVALCALGVVGWYCWRHVHVEYATATVEVPVSGQSKSENQKAKTSGDVSPLERSHLADDLNSPQKDIRSDLRVVAEVLEAFRSNFPHDGNPIGSNAEITAALTGKNKLQLALIPSDHPAINANGELCDRWGTPFFFHAESGTRMAVRSAGPDRKMWTADDVVFEP